MSVTALLAGALFVALACGACDKSNEPTQPKFFCKMQGDCWRCTNADQQTKCMINPLTSGCTKAPLADCEH